MKNKQSNEEVNELLDALKNTESTKLINELSNIKVEATDDEFVQSKGNYVLELFTNYLKNCREDWFSTKQILALLEDCNEAYSCYLEAELNKRLSGNNKNRFLKTVVASETTSETMEKLKEIKAKIKNSEKLYTLDQITDETNILIDNLTKAVQQKETKTNSQKPFYITMRTQAGMSKEDHYVNVIKILCEEMIRMGRPVEILDNEIVKIRKELKK